MKVLTWLIAAVWLINGLFCKVLNLVPRHSEIIARIAGEEYAGPLTKIIGIAEIIMAIWIVSGFKSRINAITQIIVVTAMNSIEFLLVPDLLLFGKMNAVIALLFIVAVYCNEFIFKKTPYPG